MEPLVQSLKALLVASSRKGVELNAAALAEAARGGREAVDKRTGEFENQLHIGSPDVSKFPSPVLTPEQRRQIAAAAKKRRDDPAVRALLGTEDRLYLRLKGDVAVESGTQKEIADYLDRKGYRVVDYNNGYATDAQGKQQFKIGKLLKDDDALREKFRVDANRTLGSQLAVISRDPEDIAAMSTGRAWSSCMGSGGPNFDPYVPEDVRKWSLVAYLVSEKDPEIVNPLARVMIKPFVKKLNAANIWSSAAKLAFSRSAPRPEVFVTNKTYGLPNDAFRAAVERFLEEKLNGGKEGEFRLPETVYADGMAPEQIRKDGTVLRANGTRIVF